MVDGRFEKVEGTDFELPCELVLLAMGFIGPERGGLLEQLGVELDPRSNVARDDRLATNVDGVFVAGDMGRGQSLIVWAIAEGRACAAAVDRYLMGDTALPRPIDPTDAAPLTDSSGLAAAVAADEGEPATDRGRRGAERYGASARAVRRRRVGARASAVLDARPARDRPGLVADGRRRAHGQRRFVVPDGLDEPWGDRPGGPLRADVAGGEAAVARRRWACG